jgi:tetratricopeptide (TPR) repeat protein
MMRGLALAFLLMTGAAQAQSEGLRLFESARIKLDAGEPSREDFRRAAVALRKETDAAHPETFLNLGNAHYLADELPEAIAAYHAGLRIDPSSGRLYANLALARRDVALPADAKLAAPPVAWQRYAFQRWFRYLDVAAALAASLILPVSLRTGWVRGRALGWMLVLIAALAGGARLVRLSYQGQLDQRPICVLRVDTPLRVGNADSYPGHPDAGVLPRGYEVRRRAQRGGWLHVECPGGQIGWVPEANVVPLVGQASSLPRT